MKNFRNDRFKLEMNCNAKRTLFASILLLLSPTAYSMSLQLGALGGYEVLSYRDDPSKLTGGAVSAGDSFEQASFVGPVYGFAGDVGLVQLGQIEALLGCSVVQSSLAKSATEEGYKTEGSFKFTHATLGVGGRFGLSKSFSLTGLMNFSTAISNTMKNSKVKIADGASVGEVNYTVDKHKKTSLQLGLAFTPASNGILVGVNLQLGSGCFDCTSNTSPLQKRSYLTRSGVLQVGWMLGQQEATFDTPRAIPNTKKIHGKKPLIKAPVSEESDYE
ncbi:hypothetical protein EBU99_02605 [bacterium]|nr:hypothetical protein [bacterium]